MNSVVNENVVCPGGRKDGDGQSYEAQKLAARQIALELIDSATELAKVYRRMAISAERNSGYRDSISEDPAVRLQDKLNDHAGDELHDLAYHALPELVVSRQEFAGSLALGLAHDLIPDCSGSHREIADEFAELDFRAERIFRVALIALRDRKGNVLHFLQACALAAMRAELADLSYKEELDDH